MDSVSSFSFLIENLPLWKKEIAQLSRHTSQKYEEFKAEYTRIVMKATPRRIRSASACSIHTTDDTVGQSTGLQRQTPPPPPNPVDISPFEAGNRYIYAQATKKRKPGTSFRSGASGPMKFRSKQKVVIYYDSHVQDKLDKMVKTIGGARNILRKGKMSYTIAKGLQLPALGRKADVTSSASGLDGVKLSSGYRSMKNGNTRDDDISDPDVVVTGEAAFKHVDKELESCQNLCETAAHQFLRDGDCTIELDTVSSTLSQVEKVAQTALEAFRTELSPGKVLQEALGTSDSMQTESDATLVEKSPRDLFDMSHQLSPFPQSSFSPKCSSQPTSASMPPVATEIEVDDDSSNESSIEIDISQYRSMNRAGNRAGVRT